MTLRKEEILSFFKQYFAIFYKVQGTRYTRGTRVKREREKQRERERGREELLLSENKAIIFSSNDKISID